MSQTIETAEQTSEEWTSAQQLGLVELFTVAAHGAIDSLVDQTGRDRDDVIAQMVAQGAVTELAAQLLRGEVTAAQVAATDDPLVGQEMESRLQDHQQ